MPTWPKPEMRPLSRKVQASGSLGVPKAGARPPADGGVGGASGERLTPGAAGEPGRLIGSGAASFAGGGANASVCARAAAGTSALSAGTIQTATAQATRATDLLFGLFTLSGPIASRSLRSRC